MEPRWLNLLFYERHTTHFLWPDSVLLMVIRRPEFPVFDSVAKKSEEDFTVVLHCMK
jgi:hypothetical protein